MTEIDKLFQKIIADEWQAIALDANERFKQENPERYEFLKKENEKEDRRIEALKKNKAFI
jgi:hypothetical protein